MGVEEVARARHEQFQRVEEPARAAFPPRLPHRLRGGEGGHGGAEERENMRRVGAEALEHRLPRLRVLRRNGGDPRERGVERLADAEIGSIRKYAGEAILDRREGEPVLQQRVLVRLKERRAREHRQIHRREVVAEAGQRQFARLHGAAGRVLLLDHRDAPALFSEAHGGRQPIVARPDNDRVIFHLALAVPDLLCIATLLVAPDFRPQRADARCSPQISWCRKIDGAASGLARRGRGGSLLAISYFPS